MWGIFIRKSFPEKTSLNNEREGIYGVTTNLVFTPSRYFIFWYWWSLSIFNILFYNFLGLELQTLLLSNKKISNPKNTFKNLQNMHSDEGKSFIQFKKIIIHKIQFKFNKTTYSNFKMLYSNKINHIFRLKLNRLHLD